ncbi:MAG: beta-mannosidase [Salibacteraceae bacterium]|jgi:beta-mannosidase
MGTLYWQLNDCWPAVSWSSIDYFGNWKALHYQAKKSFENVLISAVIKDNHVKIHIVNDHREPVSGQLKVTLIDFQGNNSIEYNKEQITVFRLSSELVFNEELTIKDKSTSFLRITFDNKTRLFYFNKPKDLKLDKAPIEKIITKTTKGFQITLRSTTLQKNVFLHTKAKGYFSDNYFDLMPNTIVEIEFETEAKIEKLVDLKIKTLNDLVQ